MSKKIIPAETLSDFDKQYLLDRGQNWQDYILAPAEVVQPEEVKDEESETDDEDVPYPEWDVDELETELARRNAERDEDNQLQPVGTGKNGNVLKADLIKTLEADDAAASDADDEGNAEDA